MTLAVMSISFGGNIFLLVLFLLAMIAASILFYRYTLPPIPGKKRFLLSLLRALSLCLLLGILFEPVLRSITTTEQPPIVAVLVDVSQSMSIHDGTGDRSAQLFQFVHQDQKHLVPPQSQIEYFPFAENLHQPQPALRDTFPLEGEVTNISDALAQLKDRLSRQNIQSVVLVSDGNYTAGKNPLYDAEGLGIPVYTVGVGDTVEQKDVLIKNVVTNNIAYAETRVPVDVTVKSSGYHNETVEVTLQEGSTTLDHAIVKLSEGTNEYPVHLFFEPKEEGEKKITVTVSKLPGELTDRNNTRSLYVKVLRNKLRLILFGGEPNADIPAIRQIFLEDQHFGVRSFIQKAGGGFYEGSSIQSVLDSADCILFVGFPTQVSGTALLQQIHDHIEKHKTPLLYVGGKTVDYQKLNMFETFLPFGWSGINPVETYVFPSIPEVRANHPLITLEGTMTAADWQQLPPIYKTQTAFRAKPEGAVLATTRIQDVVLNEPLLASRSIGGQKSFAVTGYGIWHWQLLAQDNPKTERFLPAFLVNVVRWLTTSEDEKKVRIAPVKETFTTAEPVAFEGQVYDDQLRPVDHADVTVELHRGSEQFQLPLNSAGSGRYEGSLDGLGEGEYSYTAKAIATGAVLGEDQGRFSVGQVNVEFLETKMNKSLLEQMAYRTGGKYYDINNTSSLAGDMASGVAFTSKKNTEASEIEMWNWRYLAACIILLLAAEWFLRKRSGML